MTACMSASVKMKAVREFGRDTWEAVLICVYIMTVILLSERYALFMITYLSGRGGGIDSK